MKGWIPAEAAAAVLLACTVAVAADAKPKAAGPAGALLKLLDADGDGKISQKEYAEGFAKVDASGDGVITQDEIVKVLKEKAPAKGTGAQAPSARLWERLDADADGSVKKDEYEKAFVKLDKDGDGSLTEEELKAALTPGGGGRKKKP